ncbi:hypothetical protein ACP4OV_014253 [Aristida adscensionis]
MGLAGGIVRRVFSKIPCLSAGGRSHNEKGSSDHRRRWSSLRLYLCGEEINGAPEDDDEETASVKSFETCVMAQEPHVAAALPSDIHNTVDNHEGPEDQRIPGEHSDGVSARPAGEEDAATLIQSAFRALMARRQLQELKSRKERDGAEEPKSPTSASVAASVEVQVGESLSNLRLSDDSTSVHQRASQRSRPPPPPVFRVKEEWDDSTVSSNVSRKRIQSRIEATTRRERALAYAFSQQLRSCGGGGAKKRSARWPEQAEFNVGWSWLERWMAARPAEPADDCMSRNADAGSARRVVVVRRRHDAAVEEKESCGSNDVSLSAVSFDGSSVAGGGRNGLHKPGGRSRLKGARNLPRRKVALSEHRLQARSHKVSKKVHQREEPALRKDEAEADAFDACQPPTDY